MKVIDLGQNGEARTDVTFLDAKKFKEYDPKKAEATTNCVNMRVTLPPKSDNRHSEPGGNSIRSLVYASPEEAPWTMFTHSFHAGCSPVAILYKGHGAMLHYLANEWEKKIGDLDLYRSIPGDTWDPAHLYVVGCYSYGYGSGFANRCAEFEKSMMSYFKVKSKNVFVTFHPDDRCNIVLRSDGVFGYVTDSDLTKLMKPQPAAKAKKGKKNPGCTLF